MPSYFAIREGRGIGNEPGYTVMGTLICDHCGERFLITHPNQLAHKTVASSQAEWLEKVLAYDHESGQTHADKIALP